MKHIGEIRKEHSEAVREFRDKCPHKCVKVRDYSNFRYGRTVDLVCVVCEKTIVSWEGASDPDYSQPSKGRVVIAHNFIKETEAAQKAMRESMDEALERRG